MSASCACDLPRDHKQVYNIKAVKKSRALQATIPSGILQTDVLAQIMLMCKESSGSQAYVRSVEAAPKPMCVLATEQQLVDLERFCTQDPFCVLSIYPTFNLGPFYVTTITYQNPSIKTDRGNHPIVLWPVLIHQTKKFRPFHYFASTLIRLNPQLSKLRAFGTDGELQLIGAFSVTFPKAVHLRCMNHIRQDVKDKLRALGIPQTAWKEFLADVFGVQKGSHFEMRLVDAHSGDSFWEALQGLEERWNNLENGCSLPRANPQFYRWFCVHKAKDIVECALPEIRSKTGLDPSHHFTTNNSESLNHVIKQEVDWKESKLPVLVRHLRSVVNCHNAELEKAVIRRGKWQFTTQYQQLEVPESTWFQMPPECREKHMKKVLTFSIVPNKLFSVASTS